MARESHGTRVTWHESRGARHVARVTPPHRPPEQAFTNRAAIEIGSAAGPSTFLAALKDDHTHGWKRQGTTTIKKKISETEAQFYQEIVAQVGGAEATVAVRVQTPFEATAAPPPKSAT